MNDDERREALANMRGMVLTFSGEVARRCVETVVRSGLTSGYLEESIEAEGVTWELTAFFNVEQDLVKITGHPERDEDHPFSPLHLLFGGDADHDAGFQFFLPSSWVPAGVPVADRPEALDG